MKIEFSNRQYEIEWGRAPKGGYGYWGFECEGHEFWAYGTLTEAKKQVRKQIREVAPKDYKEDVVAYVSSLIDWRNNNDCTGTDSGISETQS